MSEDPKNTGGEGGPAPQKRKRRRRRPRRKNAGEQQAQDQGSARPQEPTREATAQQAPAGGDSRRRRRTPRQSKPEEATPWSKIREDREAREDEDRRAKLRQEEEREVDPRQIYSSDPVFLKASDDVEDEFLEDLVEPEWNLQAQWVRTALVLSPFMRARQVSDAADLFMQPGDQVILSTPRGIELGTVLETPKWKISSEEPRNKILRTAGYSDSRQVTRNEQKCLEGFDLCQKLVSDKKLDMKLLSVEYLHGGGKAVFYFAAEKRVDFRQLIRELAGQLHIRIEMRQIGVRDAARLIGGIGPCGEQVCCNRFLTKFSPVSIKMAKVQSLMLNPQKVSGACGRLLCCLEYEYEQYREMLSEAPRIGKFVDSPDGRARIKELMLLDRKCVCELTDGSRKVCPWSDLRYDAEPVRDQEPGGQDRKRPRRKRGRNPSDQESPDDK
jgi:cell fate regulator YaaT (PSP1 superfamily)